MHVNLDREFADWCSTSYSVACRGGTNGATVPGIQAGGHQKCEITNM